MFIIAFAPKTSKILPKILCGKLKHVAPIAVTNDALILYQFVKIGKIEQIRLQMRDIKILGVNGWKFIYVHGGMTYNWQAKIALTCVQFTKNAIGMNNLFIQTPMALYHKLKSLEF